MKNLLGVAFGLSLAVGVAYAGNQPVNTLTDNEREEGWQLLFDGTSMAEWRGYRRADFPTDAWEVKDGLLKTVRGAKSADIITIRKFRDFVFSWEWRIEKGGNNGVKYFVTEERPAAPGHEYQMIDDDGHPDGQVATRVTASFFDVLAPDEDKPLKPAGQWNVSQIVVRGNSVEHWLNGRKVLEYKLGSKRVKNGLAQSKFKSFPDFGVKNDGHIMLTVHGDECWFRNLKVKEL